MIQNDKSMIFSGSFRNGKMVYGRLSPGEENSGKLVNMARAKAGQVSEKFDPGTVILDGPSGIGCPVISTITGVDKIVIVTEPTISGLHDLKKAAEIVLKSDRTPCVIINKWDLNAEMTDQIDEWCNQNGIRVA